MTRATPIVVLFALMVALMIAQGCAPTCPPAIAHAEPSVGAETASQARDVSEASASDVEDPAPTTDETVAAPTEEEAISVLTGPVSYYHDSLAGNLTANGETYSLTELTAASRTLPFCTRVRVTRVDNPELSVEVRVNDRGPFGRRGRILDLSRAAAEELDMIRAGVVEVRAEILEEGDGCTFHRR